MSTPVTLNNKEYVYAKGGCGEAVYIFKDEKTYLEGYNSSYERHALVTVPNEKDWEVTAAAALRMISKRKSKVKAVAKKLVSKVKAVVKKRKAA